MSSEILAEVWRGDAIESVHRGHALVLDGDGKVIAKLGEPTTITFMRSSAKPFQVLPFLQSGGAERFGFSDEEIALACASHSGEKLHVEIAKKMLEKIGLNENYLKCGAHLPFNEKVAEQMIREGIQPTAIYNNCSGKHAAMLAFAKYLEADLETYLDQKNPVQQAILQTISDFTETPKDEIKLATDGCSAPNFALKIEAMARAMMKLISFSEDSIEDSQNDDLKKACRKVVAAMRTYPELIGGTERLDTLLMKASCGKIISKIGAEGVWLCGVSSSSVWKRGLAIALKIEDGDDKRARAVVAIEILRQLKILDTDALQEYSPLPVKNRRGEAVGYVKANFELNKH